MPKTKESTKEYIVKVDTHHHHGTKVKKGDKIQLTEKQAAWLISSGVV